MATAKKQTKKDLEVKIAKLEAKLNKLSAQLNAKQAEVKQAEVKQAEVKPAEVKPAEVKPAEQPKPAETTTQPPVTLQTALENAYLNAPTTDFHQYRANVTGYTPAPNRYFVRMTAPVGTVPTSDWNQQKTSVTGYTQPSNQYFATRPRLAYHPTDKRFGSFSGTNMSVEGVVITAQTQQAPTPEVPSAEQQTTIDDSGKSKQDKLADYEADYMKRLEQAKIDAVEAEAEAQIEEAKAAATNPQGGALPKGFEAAPEAAPEPPKASTGTLPKGF
jgi:hypothetical protein